MKDGRTVFGGLYGNEELKSVFASDLISGRGAHAYILDGARGTGKHTAAKYICASAVCENRGDSRYPLPCGECASCKKILSGISVDVMTVSNGDKATIGVEAIRDVRSSLYITPNDGDRKFYIIENAHLMTPQAQNALLLSLEEPPPYVMFLLLSEDSSALLETIKSRAPTVRMERFSPEVTEEYLRANIRNADGEKVTEAAHLADGSLGAATELYLHGEDELKLYGMALELCEHLISPKKSDGMVFITTLPKDRTKLARIFSLARLALRDAVAAKKGGKLLFFPENGGIPDCMKKVSVKRLIGLISSLDEAERDIEANCSVNTVLPSLIINSQKGQTELWKTK